jgi:hypothetical protein
VLLSVEAVLEAKLQHVLEWSCLGETTDLWAGQSEFSVLDSKGATWTIVTVCWWNWLSHVYDICTLPFCGCLVCYKTCNKETLWIPLCILSIHFSIWRDYKLQFLIHTSLKILKVLLMKLKEILNKRPKIRCHTEQRKLRSSICGKTDTEGKAWVLNNAHYNRNNKGEGTNLTKVLWICLPH